MVHLGRRYRFSASHRLHSPQLSDEENRELYGKCDNPYGHGHDYVLEVVVEGEPDPCTGLVTCVAKLDEYVQRNVLADFDHKYLNEEVAEFRDAPPTTENVALEIQRRLECGWRWVLPPTTRLKKVRIYETRRNIVEVNRQADEK
ncbi:MAG TPA: 6-carboxytetrahydropterin synthase [Bryobacteraceae bacterium]|nr:6-carboxytetrahydropterin synthase [Bryobacteraceae bacterium]